MTSIHDVAREAGVSAATVSRVVNRTKFVSPAVRERVKAAIDKLNYQPSAISRNFRLQRTNIVGVVLPSLQDYFFGSLALAIEKAMLPHRLRPMFCSTEHNPRKELEYLDMLVAQGVDGIIMVPSRIHNDLTDAISSIMTGETPLVLTDNTHPTLDIEQVAPDNLRGAYLATGHLLDLGHQHIGVVVNNKPAEIPTVGGAWLRLLGMEKAYQEHNLEFDRSRVMVDDLPYAEMGYAGTLSLLDRHPEITAIFALTDEIALGAVRAAADRGIRVPEDLSIMGYGNIPLGEHLVPRLTTVNHSTTDLARISVEKLLRQIEQDNTVPSTVTTDVSLIVRESTSPVS